MRLLPDPKGFSFRFETKYLTKDDHVIWTPVPDDLAAAIGKIILSWSGFEGNLNQLIAAMLEHNNTEPPSNWRRQNFKKRIALARDEARKAFQASSALLSFVRNIFEEASTLQVKRNILAHGDIIARLQFEPRASTTHRASILAVGLHQGKEVKLSLDYEAAEVLAYQFAILHGRLLSLSVSMPNPTFSSHDRFVLQAFWAGNSTSFPILPT